MYSNGSDLGSTFTSINSLQRCNYDNEYYPCNGSFHHYNPCSIKKPSTDDNLLEKFQPNTLVKLEKKDIKNIQHLTTDDFLTSAKQSEQYSSLLARVEYIGDIDKVTGKTELRFYINGIKKTISYYISQEMPFFVHQYSCWSSISPESTRRQCGLNCRQLECGDLILALTEQQIKPLKIIDKPDYTQQSPTKCLVERYMNDNVVSKNKRFKNL